MQQTEGKCTHTFNRPVREILVNDYREPEAAFDVTETWTDRRWTCSMHSLFVHCEKGLTAVVVIKLNYCRNKNGNCIWEKYVTQYWTRTHSPVVYIEGGGEGRLAPANWKRETVFTA